MRLWAGMRFLIYWCTTSRFVFRVFKGLPQRGLLKSKQAYHERCGFPKRARRGCVRVGGRQKNKTRTRQNKKTLLVRMRQHTKYPRHATLGGVATRASLTLGSNFSTETSSQADVQYTHERARHGKSINIPCCRELPPSRPQEISSTQQMRQHMNILQNPALNSLTLGLNFSTDTSRKCPRLSSTVGLKSVLADKQKIVRVWRGEEERLGSRCTIVFNRCISMF